MQNTITKNKTGDSSVDTVSKRLILFNSSHIWEDVIIQLEKATGYDMLHCEQIALIAHTRGKAVVKSGNMDELTTVESVLKEISLVTRIE